MPTLSGAAAPLVPVDMPALGVESAMPGLDVTESTWDAWDALIKTDGR